MVAETWLVPIVISILGDGANVPRLFWPASPDTSGDVKDGDAALVVRCFLW